MKSTNEISCCGFFVRFVCIVLLFGDIAIGWYSYHELRQDIGSFEDEEPHTYCKKDRIDSFWMVYIGFEAAATLFKLIQIGHLLVEMCDGYKTGSKFPFFFVVLSYSAEIGSALTTVIFMQFCECQDLTPSNWTSFGKADFAQKLVSGAALVMIQLLIHATSIANKCCAIRNVLDVITDDDEPGCCMAFLNIVFFLAYLGALGAEIYYAFCS